MLIGLVCLGLVAGAMIPRSGVTKGNFDRVENGMTKTEVEQIFGNGPNFESMCFPAYGIDNPSCHTWTSGDGSSAQIIFDADRVHEKTWTPSTETIFQKLRRWLIPA
jgi:hypothetical protein